MLLCVQDPVYLCHTFGKDQCSQVPYRYARAVSSEHVQFCMERTIIEVCMINDCWLWFTHCTFRPPPILKCSHNERVALLEWRLCSYRRRHDRTVCCACLMCGWWTYDLYVSWMHYSCGIVETLLRVATVLWYAYCVLKGYSVPLQCCVRTLYSYTVCWDRSMASDHELDSVGLVQFLCVSD